MNETFCRHEKAPKFPEKTAEQWRRFYSLLDLHVRKANLVELGLAKVTLSPNRINDKTFAVTVQYHNASKYPMELYLQDPHNSGIVAVSHDNGANWQGVETIENKRRPERVLVQPGESVQRLIALNRLAPLADIQDTLTVSVDLYARPLPPDTLIDVAAPMGARIAFQQEFPLIALTADSPEYPQLVLQVRKNLAADSAYAKSTALEVSGMVREADLAAELPALGEILMEEKLQDALPWKTATEQRVLREIAVRGNFTSRLRRTSPPKPPFFKILQNVEK